jgi:hypothetical protein
MRRRRFVQILTATAVAGLGTVVASTTGVRVVFLRAAGVPRDIMARIRRRTRPLDLRRLDSNDDLAG